MAPPTALWWLAGGLVVFVIVDCTHLVQGPTGGYQTGGYIDGLWVLTVTIAAAAPGWQGHPAVIDLSHTLGVTTVAEGVETADTAAVLAKHGCDVVQVHFYSPPLTTDHLMQLLGSSSARLTSHR